MLRAMRDAMGYAGLPGSVLHSPLAGGGAAAPAHQCNERGGLSVIPPGTGFGGAEGGFRGHHGAASPEAEPPLGPSHPRPRSLLL